jgi:hypothetical protein
VRPRHFIAGALLVLGGVLAFRMAWIDAIACAACRRRLARATDAARRSWP